MKSIITLLFALILIAGCGGKEEPKQQADTQEAVKQAPVKIKLAEFKEKAGELIGKEIIITGIVDHTCKHSGKRMFLMDEKSEAALKVEAGKNISTFDASLTGNTVEVLGLIKEKVVDKDYLDKWEQDLNKDKESDKKIHDGKHEDNSDEDEKKESLDKINTLRQKLEKTGKDKLSFYSVECIKYKIIK